MMSLIVTAIVGLIVGAIAKFVMPGRDPGGILVTMLIGIAGAFLARFLGSNVFGWYRDGTAPGWIASICGAILLLWLWRLLNRNSAA